MGVISLEFSMEEEVGVLGFELELEFDDLL